MVLTTVLLSGMFMVICFVSVAISQRLQPLTSHAQSQSETSKRQSARKKAALAAATAALR